MNKSISRTCLAAALSILATTGSHASDYTQTRYPIVLVPGAPGFVSIAGIDYFYGIRQRLASDGATVLTPQISASSSTATRGEQLASYLQTYMALHPEVKKFNLMSHSYGAPTVRYVAGIMPANIASVTTAGGTNNGNKLADVYENVAGIPLVGSALTDAVGQIADMLAGIVSSLSSGQSLPQDVNANLYEISTAGAAAFNASFPAGVPSTPCGQGASAVNGVNYFSWSGTGGLTEVLDPTGYALAGTKALSVLLGVSESDGLVGRCESHLGVVLRDNYFMNHLDEVNQVLGLVSIFESNPKTVYALQANRLKGMGL